MRFSPSGLSFVAPSSIHRAVTAAIVLPATLVAASAFAQVPPPDVTARSWVLVDATSNQVLASGNPDERSEPDADAAVHARPKARAARAAAGGYGRRPRRTVEHWKSGRGGIWQ